MITIRHPSYQIFTEDWDKYRLTYEGGKDFVTRYLIKMSERESNTDFEARTKIAYNPAFAEAAINDIKNALFQRLSDVVRNSESETYRQAVAGQLGGVDNKSSSMGTFIGSEIIVDLLIMSRVGVLVDMPEDLGITLDDKGDKHPYLTTFTVENVLSWNVQDTRRGFESLLLREYVDKVDENTLLINGQIVQYRYYRRTLDGVLVQLLDHEGSIKDERLLNIRKIPFVSFQIPRSLLKNVADYQIALLNLESCDINFARLSNFPFYYEFYDPNREPVNAKQPSVGGTGEASNASTAKTHEIRLGTGKGRRFPKDIGPPGYINPDPATLEVSMKKGEQLREDIRLLVNLNLMTMNPRRQSVDSKEVDKEGLEAGLSYIGLMLQKGEQEIAEHWNMFEGVQVQPQITYPKTYNLRTEDERLKEGKEVEQMVHKVPSVTYKRAMMQRLARLLITGHVTEENLLKIEKEIEQTDILLTEPNTVMSAHKSGLVDDETASNTLGFLAKDVIEKAREDRALRIKLAMEAQGGVENASGARGAEEFGGTSANDERIGKDVRGKADPTSVSEAK